jgi:septal ring factor EnvC (AmiA/AmiB activator)
MEKYSEKEKKINEAKQEKTELDLNLKSKSSETKEKKAEQKSLQDSIAQKKIELEDAKKQLGKYEKSLQEYRVKLADSKQAHEQEATKNKIVSELLKLKKKNPDMHGIYVRIPFDRLLLIFFTGKAWRFRSYRSEI